ncbi:MAG: glucans biosynthesis glucosyltransferase MdoH [Pseudomonadota bacterium]
MNRRAGPYDKTRRAAGGEPAAPGGAALPRQGMPPRNPDVSVNRSADCGAETARLQCPAPMPSVGPKRPRVGAATDPLADAAPPRAPRAMPTQPLDRAAPRGAGPGDAPQPFDAALTAARAFLFGFATLATAGLAAVFLDWFRADGIDILEMTVTALAAFTFFWIALSVAMAILGCLPARRPAGTAGPALTTAILVPVYGEPVAEITANLRALLEELDRTRSRHRFEIFILSDRRNPAEAAREWAMVRALRRRHPRCPIWYRRRVENTRYKAGNIEDWVKGWGGAYEAMLVLDADSLMSGQAMTALADALAADPKAGLIQTVPQLAGAQSLFARLQQFSNTIYGATLARGLSRWSGDSANYWGHNAILRTAAFADAAGLPQLSGRPPFGGTILSHDFVEAALLRRAGWRVRFRPDIGGSFEGTPETLIGHVLRDRRWCQGNLQHLRLIGTRGFTWVSRMHLFQGAMAYCASLGWFALLVLWVIEGARTPDSIPVYFDAANPLYVVWPEIDRVAKALILAIVYTMLIAPKLLGALAYWQRDPTLAGVGGPIRFCASWLLEVLWSVLLAPAMMIQHIVAVCRTLAGVDAGWRPNTKGRLGPGTYLRFHAGELFTGCLMAVLYVRGDLSPWLVPIAVSLVAAPLLSAVTSLRFGRTLLTTPQETAPPRVLRRRDALLRHADPTPPSVSETAAPQTV